MYNTNYQETQYTNVFNNVEKTKEEALFNDTVFQKTLLKILIEKNTSESSLFIMENLKVEYFSGDIALTFLFKNLIFHFTKHSYIPTYEGLRISCEQTEGSEIYEKIKDLLVDIQKNTNMTDEPQFTEIALDFCQRQILKQFLAKGANMLAKKHKTDEIIKAINAGASVLEPKSTGLDYAKDFEKRMVQSYRNPIPVLEGINMTIGGGLSGGELGIILAPTGGGKSMMLVKIAADAYFLGKKVLYYSLELSENVVSHRFDACLNNIPLNDVMKHKNEIRENIEHIIENGGQLRIKRFTSKVGVMKLKRHLADLKKEGFVPDIIFVDYADIMKCDSVHGEKRFALTDIYENLRDLGVELNVPIWTASQTNKEASVKKKFDAKDVSECWGKIQTADLVIGIARDSEFKRDNVANLQIFKNRFGPEGAEFMLTFDTSRIDIRVNNDAMNKKFGAKGLGLEKKIVKSEDVTPGTNYNDRAKESLPAEKLKTEVTPNDVENWSKAVDHVKRNGIGTIDTIKQLRTLSPENEALLLKEALSIETQTKLPIEHQKPEFTPTCEQWDKTVEYINRNGAFYRTDEGLTTIQELRKKYSLSPENEKLLLATTNNISTNKQL